MATNRILIAALLATVACGGDDGDPTGLPVGSDGTLTASITGYPSYTATVVIAAYANGTFTVTTSEVSGANTRSITLLLNGLSGPNTYSLTVPGNSAVYSEVSTSSQSWLCASTQGSGSVVFSQLSATRVVGTFSFTAPGNAVGGTTGTRIVSGSFNVVPSNAS